MYMILHSILTSFNACVLCIFFFFKQKTAYEMRISDWSSDVCSSDLLDKRGGYCHDVRAPVDCFRAGNEAAVTIEDEMNDDREPGDGDLVEGDDKLPVPDHVQEAVRTLLAWAGEDPSREGLLDTPARVGRAWKEYCRGYEEDPSAHPSRTFREVGGYDEIVLLKDIPFQSHCEHHLAPIIGKIGR